MCIHRSFNLMQITYCKYLFNDWEGTDYPKGAYWGASRIKSKKYGYIYESSSLLNARCSGTDAIASGKRFPYLIAVSSSSGLPV